MRTSAMISKIICAGIVSAALCAPAAAASERHHHRAHHVYPSAQSYYPGGNGYYDGAAFPNTEDRSAVCINGYRYIRHNYDWFRTTAQDEVPVRCR